MFNIYSVLQCICICAGAWNCELWVQTMGILGRFWRVPRKQTLNDPGTCSRTPLCQPEVHMIPERLQRQFKCAVAAVDAWNSLWRNTLVWALRGRILHVTCFCGCQKILMCRILPVKETGVKWLGYWRRRQESKLSRWWMMDYITILRDRWITMKAICRLCWWKKYVRWMLVYTIISIKYVLCACQS